MFVICNKRKLARDRRGLFLTELIVAAGILVVVMSVVTTLTVKNARLRQDARHYRLAVDELSNQLDRLTSLDEASRQRALENLSPSPQIEDALPNPALKAETITDADGKRLVLRLSWDRPGKRMQVTLVGWINPLPTETSLEES